MEHIPTEQEVLDNIKRLKEKTIDGVRVEDNGHLHVPSAMDGKKLKEWREKNNR